MKTIVHPSAVIIIPAPVKTIDASTDAQIIALAAAHLGRGLLCSYVHESKAKTLKNSPHEIVKRTTATALLGPDYEAGINAQREKEAKEKGTEPEAFKAGALPWGNWIAGCEGLAIEHTDKEGNYKRYLRLGFSDSMSDHRPAKVEWFKDGKPCDYEDAEPFLLASEKTDAKEANKEAARERQGTENARHPRAPLVSGFLKFKVGGIEIAR